MVPFCLILSATIAIADSYEGPYFGTVTEIVDGDTFGASVSVWPHLTADVRIRIRGIDAPELRRDADCEAEPYYGSLATLELQTELPIGTEIRLEHVESGSFSGRFIADVFRQNEFRGTSIVTQMLRTGYVVPWDPTDPDVDWCAHFFGGDLDTD